MKFPSFSSGPDARPIFPGRVFLAAVFLLFSAEWAGAQQRLLERSYDKSGDTRIEVESVFSSQATRGFVPVRVTIRNATVLDREWNLEFNYGSGWNEMAYRSNFSIEVDSGAEVIRELLVPAPTALNPSGGYRQLTVRASSPGLPSEGQTDSLQTNLNWPGIAISRMLADRNITRLNSEAGSRGGSRGNSFGATFEAESLPSDWRGYTSLDILMLTEEEWDQLGPGARMAILEWIRLGGRLDLYTKKPQAGEWLATREFTGARSKSGNTIDHGLGLVRAWTWDGQNLDANQVVTRYAPYPNLAKKLVSDYSRDWPLLSSFGSKSFNAVLVVLLLIAFGIVVGPINLFVLAKPGRRHRLFITTPVISLVASLLILAIILLGDGIGGSGRRALLALLEPGDQEKRLYVTQEQISRTGVLLGSGFQIDEPVLLSPVILPPSAWNRYDSSNNPVASFSLSGKTWRGDWFQSRSEQGQFLQTVRPTRSRVEVKSPGRDGEPPELVSSLEFSIDEFYYRDAGGAVWKAPTAGPFVGGEAIPLVASDEESLKSWWAEQISRLSAPSRKQSERLWKQPGHFFATSTDEDAGFVETLGSIRWKEDFAVICGSIPSAKTGSAPAPEVVVP